MCYSGLRFQLKLSPPITPTEQVLETVTRKVVPEEDCVFPAIEMKQPLFDIVFLNTTDDSLAAEQDEG